MAKISSPSKALSEFILGLHLSLNEPQMRDAVDVVDSLAKEKLKIGPGEVIRLRK